MVKDINLTMLVSYQINLSEIKYVVHKTLLLLIVTWCVVQLGILIVIMSYIPAYANCCNSADSAAVVVGTPPIEMARQHLPIANVYASIGCRVTDVSSRGPARTLHDSFHQWSSQGAGARGEVLSSVVRSVQWGHIFPPVLRATRQAHSPQRSDKSGHKHGSRLEIAGNEHINGPKQKRSTDDGMYCTLETMAILQTISTRWGLFPTTKTNPG